MPPDVLAITVTYNSEHLLKDFLYSLKKQSLLNFRVVIIDNCSTDGTISLLKQIDDPRIQVIFLPRNVGVAAANNIGMRYGIKMSVKTIILINNDVMFNENLFAVMSEWCKPGRNLAVSPVIPYFDEPEKVWFAGGEFQWWRGFIGYHLYHRRSIHTLPQIPYTTGYAPTTCLAFPIDWIHEIGFLDEQYFIYWEDTDFSRRIIQAGKSIVVDPSIHLYHKVSSTTGGTKNLTTLHYMYRNHMIFIRKFYGYAPLLFVLPILCLKGMISVCLGREDFRQFRTKAKAVLNGITMQISSDY